MDSTHEMALDLAEMVRFWFDDNPHALNLPRARFLYGFAGAVLSRLGQEVGEEPEEVTLAPAEFARYHRGATPQTGRARRRK